jgi:hypothetical protein
MKKEKILLMLVIPLLLVDRNLPAQEKSAVEPQQVVGNWEVVVEAEGMIIYLTLKLEMVEKALAGRMSDQYGTFTDTSVSDLKLENDTLTFGLTVPSPPDGLTRMWSWELKVDGDQLDGIVFNTELGISVPVRGRKIN